MMIDATTDATKQEAKPPKVSLDKKWLDANLHKLKALDKPTKEQQLIIQLSERATNTAADESMLRTLVRAQIAEARAQAAREKAQKAIKTQTEEERKARNHRLIKQGLLFDYLGLESRSRAELMGMLLAGAKVNDAQLLKNWASVGAEFLKEKETAIQKNPVPTTAKHS